MNNNNNFFENPWSLQFFLKISLAGILSEIINNKVFYNLLPSGLIDNKILYFFYQAFLVAILLLLIEYIAIKVKEKNVKS